MITIREEHKQDIPAIREVNIRTFGQTQEADIVSKLRRNCNGLLSLVAIMQNQVVGHILFSPATVEHEDRTVEGMGLAPMAVLPERQRQGIGSELIRAGIASLKRRRRPFAIVLGTLTITHALALNLPVPTESDASGKCRMMHS